MFKYKHKKTNIIIKAERFKKDKADIFIDKQPFVLSTMPPDMDYILASRTDYILYYETAERIFKTLIPAKELRKNFIKIKEKDYAK